MMKKTMMLFSGLCLFSLVSIAQEPAATGPIIYKKDRNISTTNIESDASGNLTFADGPVKAKAKRGDYLYAWIPKPAEIVSAEKLLKEGKFKELDAAVAKFNPVNKFLGWELTMAFLDASAKAGLGNKADAVKKLEDFKKFEVSIPEKQESQLMDVLKLLSSLYIDAGNFTGAEGVYATMGKAKDEGVAAIAFNGRGEILYKQGKKKEAVLMYLQTAMLFPPTNPERPEALLKAANILSELSDARGTKFGQMLKAEYPNSPLIEKLK